MSAPSLLRRLHRHRQDLPALLAATGWLFVAWLVLDLLPGKIYRHLLTPRVRGRGTPPTAEQTERAVGQVRWAVLAVSRRAPWRVVCFHRGIAAQRMLCARGIAAELHYGVGSVPGRKLAAHVWVEACGRDVMDGEVKDQFTPLHVYRSRID